MHQSTSTSTTAS